MKPEFSSESDTKRFSVRMFIIYYNTHARQGIVSVSNVSFVVATASFDFTISKYGDFKVVQFANRNRGSLEIAMQRPLI